MRVAPVVLRIFALLGASASVAACQRTRGHGTVVEADAGPPGGEGAWCEKDKQCLPPLMCHLSLDGGRLNPGKCKPGKPIYEGRPLVVEGAPRTAHRRRDAWGAFAHPSSELTNEERAHAIAWLRDGAFEEHASIAAFARTICELLALGAPSALVKRTNEALADEIAHAEESFSWLAALGTHASPGEFPEATAPLRTGPELGAELLRDVFRGGCVGETLAAHRAAEHAAASSDASLIAFFTRVSEDEARHAALAFDTVKWLVARDPTLSSVLEAEARAADRTSVVTPLLDWLISDLRSAPRA